MTTVFIYKVIYGQPVRGIVIIPPSDCITPWGGPPPFSDIRCRGDNGDHDAAHATKDPPYGYGSLKSKESLADTP